MARMLRFERRVVDALISSTDPALRSAVHGYVDRSLRSMPEHLRAGIVAETLLLGAWASVRRGPLTTHLDAWRASRISLVRQYVRLLQSQVLFSENELAASA